MFRKRIVSSVSLVLFVFTLFAHVSVQGIQAYSTAKTASLTEMQLPTTDLACLPAAYSLEELVDCIIAYMPAEGSEGYVVPGAAIQNDWRTVVEQMMNLTDISGCSGVTLPASLVGIYEVLPFQDALNGRSYCVAMEVEDADSNQVIDRGWGTFIVNPNPERYLSIDIPHAVDDDDTEKQGIAVFKGVGAQTFVMTGASRDANSQESPCQEGERITDVAHCTDNLFFPTVVEIDEYHINAGTTHVAMQFHGMAANASDCQNVNIYLTHGSEEAPQPTDSIVALKANLLTEQPSWSVVVPGEPGKTCAKNGTDNVQGRYLNSGDEAVVCDEDVETYNGKFIHIEQDPGLSSFRNPAVWIQAIKNTFPPLTPPVATTTIAFQDGVSPTSGYAGTADSTIRANNTSKNYGTTATCEAAGDGFASLAREALLRWDVSSIPAGSTIQEAAITLNITDDTTSAGYYLFALNRNWVESTVTWNRFSAGTGNTWQIPGAQGVLDRDMLPVGKLTPSDNGLYTFTINPAVVQSWLDAPTENNGLLVANPANSNRVIFDCRETTVAGNRPKLTVYYSSN